MLLKITHETDLNYSELISETQMELRMSPRQEQDQHRLSFELQVGPPTSVTSYFDWLANAVHVFSVNTFHRELRIVATSIVETDRPVRNLRSLPDVWPVHVDGDYSIWDYMQFGGPIVDSPALQEMVSSIPLRHGMPLAEVAHHLLRTIDQKFTYETGVTTAASPISVVLEHKRGVCQDFTHLMIGMARALGIPARYVSGFVHPDGERYRGYAQTHAWCELFFPSSGWLGFDPTNNCVVGNNFVKMGIGRHYADLPPHRGMYKGNAKEQMSVVVQSEELTTIPAQLAAEKMAAIPIPTYPTGREVVRENLQQFEEQQQQHHTDRKHQQEQQQQ